MSENQTDNAKAIAIVLVAGVIVVTVATLGNEIMKFLGFKDSEEDKKAKAAQAAILATTGSDIKNYIAKGIRPSYTDAQYLKAASIIQNATNKSALDDKDDVAIREILYWTPKEVDYLKLCEAFGSRDHFMFGVSKGLRTLPELIAQEFSDKEKGKINAAWAKRGLISKAN